MELPKQQAKLYAILAGGADIDIDVLYRTLLEKEPPKNAQQHIGPYISKLNRRIALKGEIVRPGKLKRTYSLQKL